jgi:hypothetical protein
MRVAAQRLRMMPAASGRAAEETAADETGAAVPRGRLPELRSLNTCKEKPLS